MADLTPEQFTETDKQTPQPLVECQSRRRERVAAELYNHDLQQTTKHNTSDGIFIARQQTETRC